MINTFFLLFQEIKAVETKLEEYAAKTLEEISNYYVQLHSFLQNEERHIMDKFSEMCQQPQFMLRESNVKLNESQETLNVSVIFQLKIVYFII